jgi:predicted SnoaL-like aldol condensation-catalyzing enzyme
VSLGLHRNLTISGRISFGDGSNKINQQSTAFYDLFRVKNSKIAEHWGVISSIAPTEQAANSNAKF